MTSPTGNGLSSEVIASIKRTMIKHSEVEAAILYGSRAIGRYKPGSDIDLTLKGPDLDLNVLNRLRWDLDELMLPYQFDLSIYQQIENADLIKHIDQFGVPFYP